MQETEPLRCRVEPSMRTYGSKSRSSKADPVEVALDEVKVTACHLKLTEKEVKVTPDVVKVIVISPKTEPTAAATERKETNDGDNSPEIAERVTEELGLFRDLDEEYTPPPRSSRISRKARHNTGFKSLRKKTNTYACRVCLFRASYKDELERHLRTEHGLKENSCLTCLTVFKDSKTLRHHERSCKNVLDGDTLTRDVKVVNKYRTRAHFMERCKGLLLRVLLPFSEESTEFEFNPEVGGSQGYVVLTFRCRECAVMCASYTDLLAHLQTHNDFFHSVCFYCGKWFVSKIKLYRHIASSVHDHLSQEQVHDAKETLVRLSKGARELKVINKLREKCAQCTRDFRTTHLFDKHVRSKHCPVDVTRTYRYAQKHFYLYHNKLIFQVTLQRHFW